MKQPIVSLLSIGLFIAIPFVLHSPVFAEDKIAGATASIAAQSAVTDYTTDTRVMRLKAYLHSRSSPFENDASFFVSKADRLSLDWRLVAAIAGAESTFGIHIPLNSYNAWGWGVFTGQNDGIHFTSWRDGVTKVSEGLRYNYINKGALTIDQIGNIYAASDHWPTSVKTILAQIEAFDARTPASLEISL